MSWRQHKLPHRKKRSAFKPMKHVDLNELVEDQTYQYVIGIDEVGWGSVCGPIIVAAAVVPWDFENPGFKDSKRYTTENSRKKGAEFAKEHTLTHLIHEIPAEIISKYGAGQALSYAQKKLAQALLDDYADALIVVDGNKGIRGLPNHLQVCVPKGDARVPAISAASIIAKVFRDNLMKNCSTPEWEFYKNKGYPTPEHLARLQAWGPIKDFHRMNVSVVRKAYAAVGFYKPLPE